MFVSLSTLADVKLGFKSLQNEFYYVNQFTIDIYGIEERFLTPILMRKALDVHVYMQSPKPEKWLFTCRDRKDDLRGTGALKYIEAMADRSATQKKQSGRRRTIREVLEAQGGGIWYAPKASPNEHRIWVRKAIDGIFAPYLFLNTALVDQRCNSISPVEDIDWDELAAVLTSTLFAYSVEINGSASMGAGALEAPTRKLRGYPVADIRALSRRDRQTLVSLADVVWTRESPVNWSVEGNSPGNALQALDDWLLKKCKCNVSIKTLYEDLQTVCLSRISVAKDKVKKTKKRKVDSIGSVAEAIVKAISPKLRTRNFPENFVNDAHLDMHFNIDRRSISRITMFQLFDRYEITILTKNGQAVYEGDLVQPVAEGIIRSLLWGRSTFSVSADRNVMSDAVSGFITWVADIGNEIDRMIAESALGTGYEEVLKVEVFARLGIHPMAGARLLPNVITVNGELTG